MSFLTFSRQSYMHSTICRSGVYSLTAAIDNTAIEQSQNLSNIYNNVTVNLTNSLKNISNNIWSKTQRTNTKTSAKNNNRISSNKINLNKTTATLESSGYNSKAGRTLAQIASNRASNFHGQCATYVKQAIQNAGLGDYQQGDAYKCADILSRNKNFKEISTTGLDLSSLPAGCVLVYGKGVSGYNKYAGHTEITLGNGQAASDGITNNIRQGARVFVPVSNEYLA